MDLGQRPLGVQIAGGGDHLREHGVLAELDPVDHGDVEVRRRIEQAHLDVRGHPHPVVLPGLGAQKGLVDLDARQTQALEPGQGDRVALDDLEQPAQEGLLHVGVRRGAGGHGVREELGPGIDRESQVHQIGGDEDLPPVRQRPGALPPDGQPGVVADQGGPLGGELALRAPGEAVRTHGGGAELGLGRHDDIGVVPRARRVPLQRLDYGDVPGADWVDGPSGAVEIALRIGMAPVALGAQNRGRVVEQGGEDREGRFALTIGKADGIRDQPAGGLEPAGAAQAGRAGLLEIARVHDQLLPEAKPRERVPRGEPASIVPRHGR